MEYEDDIKSTCQLICNVPQHENQLIKSNGPVCAHCIIDMLNELIRLLKIVFHRFMGLTVLTGAYLLCPDFIK